MRTETVVIVNDRSCDQWMLNVAEIPVAFTPPGGYGAEMPPPVLAGCVDPLVDGAPDLRGTWTVVSAIVGGETVTEHPIVGSVQRIEQAGDRIVITSAGVVHDMRCDGTLENGVHDVMQSDFSTRIDVVASYEEGVHILRPEGAPEGVTVTREREGEQMVWQYAGLFTARLDRADV